MLLLTFFKDFRTIMSATSSISGNALSIPPWMYWHKLGLKIRGNSPPWTIIVASIFPTTENALLCRALKLGLIMCPSEVSTNVWKIIMIMCNLGIVYTVTVNKYHGNKVLILFFNQLTWYVDFKTKVKNLQILINMWMLAAISSFNCIMLIINSHKQQLTVATYGLSY